MDKGLHNQREYSMSNPKEETKLRYPTKFDLQFSKLKRENNENLLKAQEEAKKKGGAK